jgi:hypothetical protein
MCQLVIDSLTSLFCFLQVSNFPDCLQRILQDICGPLKSANPVMSPKIRSLHGLVLLVNCLDDELSQRQSQNVQTQILQNQLPFLSLFLLHAILDFVAATFRKNLKVPTLNWEESGLALFLAFEVLKKTSKLALEFLKDNDATKRLVLLTSNSLVPLVS